MHFHLMFGVNLNEVPDAVWPALITATVSLLGTAVALWLGLGARTKLAQDQRLALRRETLAPVVDWLADAEVALLRIGYEKLDARAHPGVVEEATAVARAHSLQFRRLVTRAAFVLGDGHALVRWLRQAHRAYGDMVRWHSAHSGTLGNAHADVVAWHEAYEGASTEIAAECGYPAPEVDHDAVWKDVKRMRGEA